MIVRVVAERDGGESPAPQRLLEKPPPKAARIRLKAPSALEVSWSEPLEVEAHPQTSRSGFTEGGVLRGIGAEPVVYVPHFEPPPAPGENLRENVQERDRVDPSGHRHEEVSP